jgi:hypothetical protein
LPLETRWSAIETTAKSGNSPLLITARFAPGAEGAPPIFELLWRFALRAVQDRSASNDEE